MVTQLSPDNQAAVLAYIEDQIPMRDHWRRFTREQRKLADALDQELVRLMRKVGADDYFGALGIPPLETLDLIRKAAARLRARFSEARVRTYGLNRKAGGWIFKARRIDALMRNALGELERLHGEGRLSAYVAKQRSALIMATVIPATSPDTVENHQGERGGV